MSFIANSNVIWALSRSGWSCNQEVKPNNENLRIYKISTCLKDWSLKMVVGNVTELIKTSSSNQVKTALSAFLF